MAPFPSSGRREDRPIGMSKKSEISLKPLELANRTLEKPINGMNSGQVARCFF